MRLWHRWIGICAALFMLLIGVTGVAVQVLDVIPQQRVTAQVTGAATAPARPDAEAPVPKRPKPTGLRAWTHWITDIHSGRAFGPVGVALSILSGITLIFFAISGAWMYWQMFAKRKSAGRHSFFWKR